MSDLQFQFDSKVIQVPVFKQGLKGEHTNDNHLSVSPRQSRLRKARNNQQRIRVDAKHSEQVYDLGLRKEQRAEEQRNARRNARTIKRQRITE